MTLLKSITITLALSVAATAMAVPARRVTTTVTQPDGSQLTITSAGDEFSHFFLTDDDNTVVHGKNGAFYFAQPADNGIVPSEILASGSLHRTAAQKAFLSSLDRNKLSKAIDARRMANTARLNKSRAASSDVQQSISSDPSTNKGLLNSSFPRFGKVRTIVILVEFADKKFTIENPNAFYNDMMNKKGFNEYGATGSARDWFDFCSGGLFEPEFDVYGPYTLSKNMVDYGGNDYYGNDIDPAGMIAEAVRLADDDIDYSQYDMDSNGLVDNVYVFYAGYGESDNPYQLADTVWPHQWHMSYGGYNITADGVIVDKYATSNELGYTSKNPDGIGTFVHEFSHVMGIPDLYTTSKYSNAGALTPGEWSIMDYGCYLNDGLTPPAYNIYERNALGWIDLDDLLDCNGLLSLGNISDTNAGAIVHTDSPDEFFLLENRQQTGWDAYLPGHGLLIWHIDYNQSVFESNNVNNTYAHQYVDIVEASGVANNISAAALAAYSFPGTKKITSFNNFTTWQNKNINIPILDIVENNAIVSATVVVPPIVTPPTDVTETGFTANWEPVNGAIDYKITVATHVENEPFASTCDFGSGTLLAVPSDWTSSGKSPYTSNGNFGNSSPSLKMSVNGQTLQSPLYNEDIQSISFWMHQNAIPASSKSVLTILSGDKNSTDVIFTFSDWTSIKDEGKTITVDNIPAGTRRITFRYDKIGTGNLAVDDIEILVGGDMSETLPEYNTISTGGANSFKVNAMLGNTDAYDYKVSAVFNGGYESAPSKPMTVGNVSGIDDITTAPATAPAGYYTLQGIRVDRPVAGQIYIRVANGRASKVLIE